MAALLRGDSSSNAFAAPTPVEPSPSANLDTTRVFKKHFAPAAGFLQPPSIDAKVLQAALSDEGSRINPKFRIPPAILPLVKFWMGIYTEYTTEHVVIVDSAEPQLIYDVLDFRALAKSSKNQVVYEVVSRQRTKHATKAIRAALAALAKNPSPKKPSPLQARIIQLRKDAGITTPFKVLAHRVRSQTGQRDNVVRGLLAAEPFLPKMELMFRDMGVPLELTRLPLVESSFNIRAYSKVGAAGVWQFMPASAREFMRIDGGVVDERLSPLKATVAAAKLLNRNYKVLGDWALAVIAYNHGFRGLPRLAGKNHDFSTIAHLFAPAQRGHRRLGYASKNYYAEFLAIVHAEAYREIFYTEAPHYPAQAIAFERVTHPMDGLSLAAERGMSLQDFLIYNPDVRDLRRPLPTGFWMAKPSRDDDVAVLTRQASPRYASAHTKRRVRVKQVRKRSVRAHHVNDARL